MCPADDEGCESKDTGSQNEEQQISGRVHQIPAVPLWRLLHNAQGLTRGLLLQTVCQISHESHSCKLLHLKVAVQFVIYICLYIFLR